MLPLNRENNPFHRFKLVSQGHFSQEQSRKIVKSGLLILFSWNTNVYIPLIVTILSYFMWECRPEIHELLVLVASLQSTNKVISLAYSEQSGLRRLYRKGKVNKPVDAPSLSCGFSLWVGHFWNASNLKVGTIVVFVKSKEVAFRTLSSDHEGLWGGVDRLLHLRHHQVIWTSAHKH